VYLMYMVLYYVHLYSVNEMMLCYQKIIKFCASHLSQSSIKLFTVELTNELYLSNM